MEGQGPAGFLRLLPFSFYNVFCRQKPLDIHWFLF